jgi:hypothetical protein
MQRAEAVGNKQEHFDKLKKAQIIQYRVSMAVIAYERVESLREIWLWLMHCTPSIIR